MNDSKNKPLMRSLGEFFGHIARAVKTDPAKGKKQVVSKKVEEEQREGMILRRTTIEEIEIRPDDSNESPENQDS